MSSAVSNFVISPCVLSAVILLVTSKIIFGSLWCLLVVSVLGIHCTDCTII
jgi:hypothetical protein